MYYNNKDFKVVSEENLKNYKQNHQFRFKVYMSRNKSDDMLVTVLSAENVKEANSFIDNEWDAITDDHFTGQYADKKGVIETNRLPLGIYKSLRIK